MAQLGPGLRRLSLAAVVATYLLIVAGGVVRVSGSGLGCGSHDDWPLCEGGLLPPARQDAIIEFTHRWLAASATSLVIALAVLAWTRGRRHPRLVWAVSIAVALFVVQIVLGAATVKLSLPGSVILVHLANAQLLLGALVYVAFVAHTAGTPRGERAANLGSRALRPVRLATAAAISSYVLLLSGALVVARGAGYACAGWPLCGSGLELSDGELASINLIHRLVAVAVVALAGAAAMSIRRSAREDTGLRIAIAGASALLVAQVVAGAVLVELRLPPAARGVHLALASAVWATLLLAALLSRTGLGEWAPAGRTHGSAGVGTAAAATPS